MSCAAMAIVSMMSVSAMAATYDAATGAVTLTSQCPETADQATIIILKDGADDTNPNDEDIAYIMQLDAKADGSTFTGTDAPKLPAGLTEGKYKIKMGGTNVAVSGIVEEELNIGGGDVGDVEYGNVDGRPGITAGDARVVLNFATEKVIPTEEQAVAANVDGRPGITATDARTVLNYATEKITKFPVEEKN